MEERIQYNGIDVIKFIMAVFVVVLHTHPLEGISELLNFLLSDVIGRAGGPLFLCCDRISSGAEDDRCQGADAGSRLRICAQDIEPVCDLDAHLSAHHRLG